MMEFEFDPNKSALNKAKHGIDFFAAQELWNDSFLVVVEVMNLDEKRYLAIGQIANKCWTAVYTQRLSNIRIISVRRARKEEYRYYEGS